MRTVLITLVLLLPFAAGAHAQISETDTKLYDLVSADFLKNLNDADHPMRSQQPIQQLDIINRTIDCTAYTPEQIDVLRRQIPIEMSGKIDPLPPDEMIESLMSRSKTPAVNVDFKPTDPHVTIVSETMLPHFKSLANNNAYFEYMRTKRYVSLFPPGYSSDGKTAIIHFYFGPTAHGAAGTYVLTFDGQNWKITGRAISYYV